MEIFFEKFDSQILNKKVHKLFLSGDIDEASKDRYKDYLKENEVDIIFAFADFNKENINFFQKNKFDLISIRTTYRCADLNFKKSQNNNDFRVLDKESCDLSPDTGSLQSILKEIAQTSRYCKDSKLGEDSCLKIYNQWLINSFSGYAKKIYFLFRGETVIGFVTLRESDNKIFIDLIGLSSDFQGRELGDLLMNRSKEYCKENKRELWVITEAENVGAGRFYQRNNFLIQELQLVFHKHF